MAAQFPKQSFQLKDLPTKSVTLYLSRAHIVREIRDVVLQPGQNEIEIIGLTTHADQNSVQIDGKGAATITDMTLELVPNKEQFSEVYPSDSESSDDDDDEYEDSDDEIDSVKTLSKQIKDVGLKIEAATEQQKSAERRLKTLDAHSNGITGTTDNAKWTAEEVAQALKMYDSERQALFQLNSDAGVELKRLRKQKARLEFEKEKAGKDESKRKARELKEKAKQQEKRLRQKEEDRKERQRERDEKAKFWPHEVYKITLGLETSFDTPSSSRRNSMDSITLSGVPAADAKGKAAGPDTSSGRKVTLSLSYVANSAFWTPRYDLNISSQQKTATIVYRAEFSNGTSETWKDAKVILSTSQTSYSGLEDKPPIMSSWHVKLQKAWNNNPGGLLSLSETKGPRYQNARSQQAQKRQYKAKQNWVGHMSSVQSHPMPSHPMPMANKENVQLTGSVMRARKSRSGVVSVGGFGNPFGNTAANDAQRTSSVFRAGAGLFGAPGGAAPAQSQQASAFGAAQEAAPAFGAPLPDEEEEEDHSDGGEDESGVGLDFEESVWEDNGLTANYELPGIRTLAPSSLARRHKIASLNATNLALSYICIPKLRSAAFLRAKIRNPSTSVTLLKGTAGVTLDGSFLGNMQLPRVSPSQLFTLPLGVDPSIHISYPKPTVHRSTQGIFNKEWASTFNRSIWITNTKSVAVELLVIDQVPASEDERLRIGILTPRGLVKEGDSVKAGQAAKEGGKEVAATGSVRDGAWGKATALMKKNGEVNWNVNLEKAAACLLKLEYETRMPTGEGIVEIEDDRESNA